MPKDGHGNPISSDPLKISIVMLCEAVYDINWMGPVFDKLRR